MLLVPTLLMTLALANNANVLGATLELREIHTDARCSNEFDWAKTSTGNTPCYVAAQVLACGSGSMCFGRSGTLRAILTPFVYRLECTRTAQKRYSLLNTKYYNAESVLMVS